MSNRSSRNSHVSSLGGRAFEDTLIGSLLSKSSLPSLPGKPFLFFEKPTKMSELDIELATNTIWQVRVKSYF